MPHVSPKTSEKTRKIGAAEAVTSPVSLTSKKISFTSPLYLVFGGELQNLEQVAFCLPLHLDIVGIYSEYGQAYNAWKSKSQACVDNAHQRYFIVPLHDGQVHSAQEGAFPI